MKTRKLIASTIIASMLANTASWAFYVSLINMVMTPKYTQLMRYLISWKTILTFANPNANRNATTSAQDIVEKYKNADSGENQVLN